MTGLELYQFSSDKPVEGQNAHNYVGTKPQNQSEAPSIFSKRNKLTWTASAKQQRVLLDIFSRHSKITIKIIRNMISVKLFLKENFLRYRIKSLFQITKQAVSKLYISKPLIYLRYFIQRHLMTGFGLYQFSSSELVK